MGRYRLGDIIRMTRKSLSITQEQLSNGICSVGTLSRIETGKQNPNRDIYELLMERMGRIRERAYSMLSVSDFKVLDKMRLFEEYIKLYDYDKAEEVLGDIKKNLGNSNLDRQFMIRAESIINYRLKRIDVSEFLKRLQEAIIITIPMYGTISLSGWPLTYNEAVLLLNISTAYAEMKDYDSAVRILKCAYEAMKQSYMDEQQRVLFHVGIVNNMSKWYGMAGDYEYAIAIANEGIEICKRFKLGNSLPNLIYSVIWCKERLIDRGELPQDSKRDCLNSLLSAYYLASAMQQSFIAQFLKKHINDNYMDLTGHDIC